jgi:predicted secreted protein
MSKRLTISFTIFCVCALLYAGDVAAFVDIGFSSDGQTYLFGQYGSTDKIYEGYADIFTVDIGSNKFVKDKVFSIAPTIETKGSSGINTYKKLYSKYENDILKYHPAPANLTNVLYLRSDSKITPNEIIFKDFERSSKNNEIFYHIKLVPWYSGKTATSKSSFFISVEKQDADGNVLFKDVAGTPDFKRTGVTDYAVEKILCDKNCKSLVFVVEKKITSSDGFNIRYMVETLLVK